MCSPANSWVLFPSYNVKGLSSHRSVQFGKNIIKKKWNLPFIFNMTSARYKIIQEPLETDYQLKILTRVFSIASIRLACLTTPLWFGESRYGCYHGVVRRPIRINHFESKASARQYILLGYNLAMPFAIFVLQRLLPILINSTLS